MSSIRLDVSPSSATVCPHISVERSGDLCAPFLFSRRRSRPPRSTMRRGSIVFAVLTSAVCLSASREPPKPDRREEIRTNPSSSPIPLATDLHVAPTFHTGRNFIDESDFRGAKRIAAYMIQYSGASAGEQLGAALR
jgi:hypothetical protein